MNNQRNNTKASIKVGVEQAFASARRAYQNYSNSVQYEMIKHNEDDASDSENARATELLIKYLSAYASYLKHYGFNNNDRHNVDRYLVVARDVEAFGDIFWTYPIPQDFTLDTGANVSGEVLEIIADLFAYPKDAADDNLYEKCTAVVKDDDALYYIGHDPDPCTCLEVHPATVKDVLKCIRSMKTQLDSCKL